MGRVIGFIVFLLTLFAVDLYAFQGFKFLVKKWFPTMTTPLYYLYWIVPAALLLTLVLMATSGKGFHNSSLLRFVFSGFVILFLAKLSWAILLAVDDVVRLARFLSSASDMPNEAMMEKIDRSNFIVSLGALVSGSLVGGMIYGIARGAHNYQVLHRRLSIKELHPSLQGLKIVQISDIHSGSFWNKPAVEKGVELVMEQAADLVFFTGDLVNNESREMQGFKELFSRITAPYGVYSIVGNHDYGDYRSWPNSEGISKAENWERLKGIHKELGWNLLLNSNAILEIQEAKLGIIGVENWGKGFKQEGDIQKAYQGVEPADLKLLLSHDPSHWRAQILGKFPDIKATFSGHTHGMQFGVDLKNFKWSPVKYRYPEWIDLYEEDDQYLYVNRGFGYLGYPGRLGFYPEITVFELESC